MNEFWNFAGPLLQICAAIVVVLFVAAKVLTSD